MPDIDHQQQPDHIIFKSQMLSVGTFRCPLSYPHFENTGPIQGHLLVFPRTSVRITHAGGEPIVADPNVVMFYNRHQQYRRSKLSERGDVCEWFAFEPQLLVDILRSYDPAVVEHPNKPFCFTHGPSDPASYLAQRLLVNYLQSARVPDLFYVEESILHIMAKAIGQAFYARGLHPHPASPKTQRSHIELAQSAQAIMAGCFQEKLSLSQLAEQLYSSPYHLCRVFSCHTGYSIHHYLTQLRLRTALEYLEQGFTDLTSLALELGFAHHSHFSQAFHQTFGLPPSHFKTILTSKSSQSTATRDA